VTDPLVLGRSAHSSRHLDFVPLVTDSLVRSSPVIIALVLGIAGVTVAASAFVTGAASALVAAALGGYALGCSALALAAARARASIHDDLVSPPIPATEPPVASAETPAPHMEAGEDSEQRNGGTSPALGDAVTPDLRDPLTGLATRALLRDRLEHALSRAHRHERPVAVLVVDIDGFRSLNDALGYAVGDRVLAAVAARLSATLRAGDTAGRLGADEFALVLEDMADESNFVQVSDRVSEALSRPITVDGRELPISTCTGIAQAKADDDADDVLRNADAALAVAKRRGRGACEVFSERVRASLVDRVDLEAALRAAVDAGAFEIEYQPIVILHSRRIAGVEALLRWRHPTRGEIPPTTFLPLADELGLSPGLGRWVLEQSCRQVKHWQDQVASARSLTLTVNVSRAQLRQRSLVDDVAKAIEVSRLDPRRLVLEVSDAVLLDDAGTALARLQALKALGVRIAIDDFGARHAALHQLPRIPVDILKIDKAFIDRVGRGGVSVAHVVLALGKSMRLRTVAEGVEAEEQVTELLRLKCEFGQGILFSRPLTVAGVSALLRADRR
jgi:diguanylate cyclase (GGDEF)-like protein